MLIWADLTLFPFNNVSQCLLSTWLYFILSSQLQEVGVLRVSMLQCMAQLTSAAFLWPHNRGAVFYLKIKALLSDSRVHALNLIVIECFLPFSSKVCDQVPSFYLMLSPCRLLQLSCVPVTHNYFPLLLSAQCTCPCVC